MSKELREIYREVAALLDLEEKDVADVMASYFNYVKFNISKIAYRNLSTFDGVKTNFLIPGFGKLAIKNRTNNRLKHERRFKKDSGKIQK